jgi:hypothetical protein
MPADFSSRPALSDLISDQHAAPDGFLLAVFAIVLFTGLADCLADAFDFVGPFNTLSSADMPAAPLAAPSSPCAKT